ncbi:hypothetical protein Hokovirus_4_66 [Hokovirus HKV1]|uniref:Early transcription factor VETF large subunit n=1 Tax=Hokovirus HKV1 TaxID=1977638 RepID=A0A1V0SH97_9VIRU|nr:hypothetical protein Hokovirus_4_66 [Hokovirus HKV1]
MNEPIKIIFRYKNNNRHIQHHTYIYVGNVNDKIYKILEHIKDLSFIDTLIEIDKSKYSELEKYYGIKWYKYFFNSYHLNYCIGKINENETLGKQIKKIYGDQWFSEHLNILEITKTLVKYSYEEKSLREKLRKDKNRKEYNIGKDELKIDFNTTLNENISSLFTNINLQTKKKERKFDIDDIEKYYKKPKKTQDNIETIETLLQKGGDEDSEIKEEEEDIEIDFNEDDSSNEISMDDIESLFDNNDVDIDTNIEKTQQMLNEAIKNNKKEKYYVDFDTSKDNINYDENLKNIFDKKYIKNQFIYPDDTIKTIKRKITCSIINNPKFDKNAFILPSRQYLFSEYYHENEIKKVMIGQKWIKRSEILTIDVEPNYNIKYYEELRGPLKILKDNIKKYGSRIKWQDDENLLLEDYKEFINNNELYLIDIYNELGQNYTANEEETKNLIDVYFRLYFVKLKSDDIKNIFKFLNNQKTLELNKIMKNYETLKNDTIMENEIMNNIEKIKEDDKYKKYFGDPHIINAVIHLDTQLTQGRLELFKIFDLFVTDKKYPFIQYKKENGDTIFKTSIPEISRLSKSIISNIILRKWFENAPPGITFKIFLNAKSKNETDNNTNKKKTLLAKESKEQIKKYLSDDKYVSITLNHSGKIEYKAQWAESEKANFQDIRKTYQLINELIEKINSENNTLKFVNPSPNDFKFAFINTLQKYFIPEKFMVNHNDLSEFASYFYPYVVCQVEPKKRAGYKTENDSKFGTYLRYKRMNNYEDQNKIEQRILFLLRHFNVNDTFLLNEISAQFNLTVDKTQKIIDNVKNKYTSIKKSRKVLKPISEIPKYTPPGISIDIQGKQEERYKIRVAGARNRVQLERIILFTNILLFLYIETYLFKIPERQELKNKLSLITNIAKRRNKVIEIVNTENMYKNLKKAISNDKDRLGFKPTQGQNQWSRLCQNSGPNKKRQPVQYHSEDELLANGFKFNEELKLYEKKVKITRKGKTETIIIKALNLSSGEEENKLYFSCNPKENGEYTYVGILLKGDNPYNLPMPCCYKRDPFDSKNSKKISILLDNIRSNKNTDDALIPKTPLALGEPLYILQNTYKVQENRYAYLPLYLNFFLNTFFGNKIVKKQHYLSYTDGYFFKYGTEQNKKAILESIGFPFGLTAEKIINKIKNTINENIFNYLNNGDIRGKFITIDKYIEYLENNILEYEYIRDICSLPGIVSKKGLNTFVFDKKTLVFKYDLEREKTLEDFNIMCQNQENDDYLIDTERDNVFLIREGTFYYPLVLGIKQDINSKTIDNTFIFKYKDEANNYVNHVLDFYNKNCSSYLSVKQQTNKMIIKTLLDISKKNNTKDYLPNIQVIDNKYKCVYIITNNNTIIPVLPSGTNHKYPIKPKIHTKNKIDFNTMYSQLNDLYNKSNKQINVKPMGVYIDTKKNTDNKVAVIGIITMTHGSVPVIETLISKNDLKDKKLVIEHKQLYDKIDEDLLNCEIDETGHINKVLHKDKRMNEISKNNYEEESYQLFRFEFSNFINKETNKELKKLFIDLIMDKKKEFIEKKNTILDIMYKITSKKLYEIFKNNINVNNKTIKIPKTNKFINTSKEKKVDNYAIDNYRKSCEIHKNQQECMNSIHCNWSNDSCLFTTTEKLLIIFINRITSEFLDFSQKCFEIFNIGNYYITDIVSPDNYIFRKEQYIINDANKNFREILHNIFGQEKMSKVLTNLKTDEIDSIYYPKDLTDMIIQKILENNNTILRAYSNGYYWVKNSLYNLKAKNLGYYSDIQTDMVYYFRSSIINWLNNYNNFEDITTNLYDHINKNITGTEFPKNPTDKKIIKKIIIKFISMLSNETNSNTNCVVEYYVLSKIYDIPIIVWNDVGRIIYIFNNGLIFDENVNTVNDLNKLSMYKDNNFLKKCISIKISINDAYGIPSDIHTICYK